MYPLDNASLAPLYNAELVGRLPGFGQRFVETDDVALHVVKGGKGPALYLLPGWPMTWWEYHAVMSRLAERFTVVAVDLRGMGATDKPTLGYDKKTMAGDIVRVMKALGHDSAHVVGSDIGGMVAYAMAANHPERVLSLTMVDTPHPFPGLLSIPLLPQPGMSLHPWWFAFNLVGTLPEQLLSGRFARMQDWVFAHLGGVEGMVAAEDAGIFADAYAADEAIVASLAWFRAFPQDLADFATYAPLTCPVLGLGGRAGDFLQAFLQVVAPHHAFATAPTPGHWLAFEDPAFFLRELDRHIPAR
jgi:pimeloyl-ACP methyl ester carboxylesterase